ncbi:MAG: glycine zipper family protein [Pseudomonadota bacterium]
MHYRTMTCAAFLAVLAACANTGSNYIPIIDGPVGPNYNNDLAQCQALAAQQGNLGSSAGQNVAVGAGVGAAGAVILDGNSDNLGEAAAVGALAGLAGSALDQQRNKERIIRNCMRGRGYNVVG